MRTRTTLIFVIVALAVGAAGLWLQIVPAAWSILTPPRTAPLPPYELELSNSVSPEAPRGLATRLGIDAILTATLRPARPVEGPVQARAFLSRAAVTKLWAVPLDSHDGLFVLRAPVRELPGIEPGHWRVSFVVGRPRAMPPSLSAARERPSDADWRLLEGDVDVDD